VWCAPCRRELPALADLRGRLLDARVEVLAINLGDSAERVAAFLAQYPTPSLPVLLDRERSSAVPWHVRGLPVAYAIDPDGVLRLGAIGERDWRASVIETQLRSLV
jgi:thiol-disulfide isomerase/thioredoxin